jgi:DNA-binding NarL/FixJ family response regulator
MKRLVIVADHSLVVEAIRLSLRQTAGFELVGYVNGAKPVSSPLVEVKPDIVIVDDMGSPELATARVTEIARALPDVRILLLTMAMDAEWLDGALAAGAHAVLCKGLHPSSFATLVREVVNGNVYHRYSSPTPAAAAEPDTGLTKRELEILGLMAGGAPNGTIARELWVTEQTVKFHLSNIYRKLGVRNRTEAAHYAYKHRLLASDELALAS